MAAPPDPSCWVAWSAAVDPAMVSHLLDAEEARRLESFRRDDDAARFATSRAILRLELARRHGMQAREVALTSYCRRCRREHGEVVATTRGGHLLAHVSISRRSDLVGVALSSAGPVGVDIEQRDAGGFADFDDVAVHAEETVSTAIDRTRLWVRKESVLKATGDGLTVDPRQLRLTGSDSAPRLVSWQGRDLAEPIWMFDLSLPDSHVGCVSVLGPVGPRLVQQPARLEEVAGTTIRRRTARGPGPCAQRRRR